MDEVKVNNINMAIIPGGYTSKIQLLDVCLSKPFKSTLRNECLKYVEFLVDNDPQLIKIGNPGKAIVYWVNKSWVRLFARERRDG